MEKAQDLIGYRDGKKYNRKKEMINQTKKQHSVIRVVWNFSMNRLIMLHRAYAGGGDSRIVTDHIASAKLHSFSEFQSFQQYASLRRVTLKSLWSIFLQLTIYETA